jgi:hypothetical protein
VEPNGDESDARMAQIEEILGHAAMRLLEKCALVAEWVHHAEAKSSVFGHFVQKPQGGRPEGGVARAARELALTGKSAGAHRKFVERALKIDGIWPEAKSAARAVGLDDNQSKLLAIASERSVEGQLKKVQEIAEQKKAPRPNPSAPQDRERDQSLDERHSTEQLDMSTSEERQLAGLRESWLEHGALKRDEWGDTSEPVRRRFFIDVLLKEPVS